MNRQDVEILETNCLYDRFLKVTQYRLRHKLFQGGWSNILGREVVLRPRVAAVLPYDPILDKVVLIEQFRPGALNDPHSPWLFEIVAGVAEDNESEEAVAYRETQEEAGLTILDLKPIYQYWVSPGICDEQLTLFYAVVDANQASGIHGLPHEHEDIKVHVLSSSEAFELIYTGHRLLSEPTAMRGFIGDTGCKTAVYRDVHEDSSTVATHKSPAEGRLCKKSIQNATLLIALQWLELQKIKGTH